MKQTLSLFILLSFFFVSRTIQSQDIVCKTDTPSLSFLKGVIDIKVEFIYEIETINGNQTEIDFVADQKKNRNIKNPGMGDKWEKEWIQNRSFLFNPSFSGEFNRKTKGKLSLNDACQNCQYKMEVHIKALRTGKDNKISTMIGQVPAGGNFRIDILDSSQKVLASFQMNNMNVMITPRNDDNFYPWINQAFAKAGKLVATEILKKL